MITHVEHLFHENDGDVLTGFPGLSELNSLILDINGQYADNLSSLCQSLPVNTLDVSNGQINNITNLSYCFAGSQFLTHLNVDNGNVSKVSKMDYLFQWCSNLTDLNVNNGNMSNAISLACMFTACKNLINLNVNNGNVSKVNNFSSMFLSCSNLQNLNLSNGNIDNARACRNMFRNCTNLINLIIPNNGNLGKTYSSSAVENMFYDCQGLQSLDLSDGNVGNINGFAGMFYNCFNLYELNLENGNYEKAVNCVNLFRDCHNLTTVYISNLNNVVYLQNAFCNCYNLEYLTTTFPPMGEEYWACNNLINAAYAFANCYNLTSLPFLGDGQWPHGLGPKTTNVAGMFYRCNNLKQGMMSLRMIGLMLVSAPNITYKNINNQNIYSPFYGTNIDYPNEGDGEAGDYLQYQGGTS